MYRGHFYTPNIDIWFHSSPKSYCQHPSKSVFSALTYHFPAAFHLLFDEVSGSFSLSLNHWFNDIVASLLNNRIIRPQHFEHTDDDAVLLNSEGKRVFCAQWQEYLQHEILHPVLKENVRIGLLPFIQANMLASYIIGNKHEYKPFIRA